MADEKRPMSVVAPGAESTEKPGETHEIVYFEGSPTWCGYLARLLGCGLLGVGLLVAAVLLRGYGWWVPAAGVLLALAVVSLPVLLIRSVRYRISNYRIDYERGIFSKDIDTLELWHVEDLNFHQSLLDRILRIGTITVVSHDETTPRLVLRALPNPRPLFDTLKHWIIVVKKQRGVIKLDAG